MYNVLMYQRFLTSPHEADEQDSAPVVFLAGPVQGAPDWQARFAHHLLEKCPDIIVASPRRTPEDQARFDADEQVMWEIRHRIRARESGVTIFWFAARDLSDTNYPEGRAYAQTTRMELGETLGWRNAMKTLNIVVGFDPAYGVNGGGSEGYIRKLMHHYDLPVYDSEDNVLAAAIRQLSSSKVAA